MDQDWRIWVYSKTSDLLEHKYAPSNKEYVKVDDTRQGYVIRETNVHSSITIST